MNQNSTREIIARIEKIISKQDKNNKKYLILEVDNDSAVFVFPTQVNRESWALLKEGQEYQFTVEEGRDSINLLVSFSLHEQN